MLKPAGFDNSTGIITAAYLKDATDPQWANDADFQEWKAWMQKYQPDANPADSGNIYAYAVSATMRHVLTQCGDDLTRDNLMKQAASMKNSWCRCCCPASRSTPARPTSIPSSRCSWRRFDGETWKLFGDVLSNEELEVQASPVRCCRRRPTARHA